MSHPPAAERLRERVRHETWQAKECQVLAELARLGIVPQTGPVAVPASPAAVVQPEPVAATSRTAGTMSLDELFHATAAELVRRNGRRGNKERQQRLTR